MKLQFERYDYQTEAVDSIVNIFKGQPIKTSDFTVSTGGLLTQGIGNDLELFDDELLENIKQIQMSNSLPRSSSLQGKNFTVEMETGTGKTFVYIKTIFELNKKYGFTKFIIVVPSIAIKEGVYKSIQTMEEFFMNDYNNASFNYKIYDSKSPEQIENFATTTNIEILIINIASFVKDLGDENKQSNLIHRSSDKLAGMKPIELIRKTNPIVIIDEPQSVDNTDKAKYAIESLNPSFVLRYSATHREKYNLMYRLDPVSAFQQQLVKQIAVYSTSTEENTNKPYIKLVGVSDNNGYKAKLELNTRTKDGSIRREVHTLKVGDDLKDYTQLDYYDNYVLDDIDTTKDSEYVQFTNNELLYLNEISGDVDDIALKRAQIRMTIDEHLKKERKYVKNNIKVLSLFFIDDVSKYRLYDDNGNEQKGIYAKIFEEEYQSLITTKYKDVFETYKDVLSFDVEKIHDGYFSIDNKGRVKNTNGQTLADDSTYNKIMKNKEKLLSFSEPLRFIFSHSALKEGWDNPNVFQVCTLVETQDNFTKRQKIGRGLRLCVNQNGERVQDYQLNQLTVIANESYDKFATDLQKEIENEVGYKFGIIERHSFANITIIENDIEKEIGYEKSDKIYEVLLNNNIISNKGKISDKGRSDIRYRNIDFPEEIKNISQEIYAVLDRVNRKVNIKNASNEVFVKRNKQVYLSKDFETLWDKIKQKTIYSIDMDTDKFISHCIEDINNLPIISKLKIRTKKAELKFQKEGIDSVNVVEKTIGEIEERINYPDPIRYIQDVTGFTRKTVSKILLGVENLVSFLNNPQKFLDEVCKIIESNKKLLLSDGIKYERINEYWEQSVVFNDDNLKAYLESNAIPSEKSVFDHVIYDSDIESEFAVAMEADEDVKLYVKLPDSFVIDTPLGNYNPDWAIILNKDNDDVLYFVVETKGSKDKSELRSRELNKIKCAFKHFESLGTNIDYRVAKEFYEDVKLG